VAVAVEAIDTLLHCVRYYQTPIKADGSKKLDEKLHSLGCGVKKNRAVVLGAPNEQDRMVDHQI
tara:strand:+ start:627 stop:818 length:192 start_codon:yes stop_codon:yes gene_type:complete